MRCVRVGLSGLLGLSVFAGIGVHAQQPQPASSDAALAAQLRTVIASDTTAFVVGHTDFRRYTTPGYCLSAVRHAVTLGRRTVAAQEALDTVRRDAAHDTLPAYTRAVAKGCVARFPAATTPVAELPHLFQLAVLAEQDTLAEAVLARRLTLAKSPSAKAGLLLDAVGTYLQAEPARVAAAEAVLARLDAMGQTAAVVPSRIAAHQQLLAYNDSTADLARVRHEADQILTLARALPADSLRGRSGWDVWTAYQVLGRVAYVTAPDSLISLARQLQQDAKRTPSLATGTGKSYAELPLDSLVRRLSPVGDLPEVGQPTPALHADLWFAAPGQAQDTALPSPGRLSLFVGLSADCYAYTGGTFATPLDPIGSGCQRTYNLLRRWRAQAGGRLDVTLVAPLTGTVAALLHGPESAADAVKSLRWYVFEYLKLPVNQLAVQLLPMQALWPAPYNLLFVQPPVSTAGGQGHQPTPETWWIGLHDRALVPFERMYHPDTYRQGLDPGVVLTGPDGRCLYSGGPSVLFDAIFARALTAQAARADRTPGADRTARARQAVSVAQGGSL